MSTLDRRVRYWTEDRPQRNFGDALSEWVLGEALVAPWVQADRYRLIGSAIADDIIRDDVADCAHSPFPRIAFWGCGMRSATPVQPQLKTHCSFHGVRGPLTRDGLGLPAATVLGDPALLLPLLHPAGPRHRQTLCVPHINEPGDRAALCQAAGADRVVSPLVADRQGMQALIDDLSGAGFVLCGSLHAAIVACAYDVPFAFWDTGFVDIPFKWQEFAASLGIEARFVDSVEAGRLWHASQRSHFRRPALTPIVRACPFRVRSELLVRAILHDTSGGRLGGKATDGSSADAMVAVGALVRAASSACPSEPADQAGWDAEAAAAAAGPVHGMAQQALLDATRQLQLAVAGVQAHSELARFCFDDGLTDLRFALGHAGMACLVQGWTVPNEVGPWAVASPAVLRLPQTTRWWAHGRLDIGTLVFAPRCPPYEGRRQVRVWAAETELGCFEVENPGSETAVYTGWPLHLPPRLRRRGGDPVLRFESTLLHSARDLGLGDDDRTLVFAPTTMKAFA
jgi:hypothetical protein